MSYEVTHKRTVSDSIAVDLDTSDGRILIEISNDEKTAEISLSDREARALIRELQGWIDAGARAKEGRE